MSRTNPDWYLDPPEERENPRCPECDQQMDSVSTWTFGLGTIYECHTPDCPECSPKWKQKVSESE